MWQRGNTYYARFRAGGRNVPERLSSDHKAAVTMLNDLRARSDRADFGLVDNDYAWEELRAEFLKWKQQTSRNPVDFSQVPQNPPLNLSRRGRKI